MNRLRFLHARLLPRTDLRRHAVLSVVWIALLLLPMSVWGAQWIRFGTRSVAVNEFGVLESAQPNGLRTIDGPRVELAPEFSEWYAVYYTTRAGRQIAMANGSERDWSSRRPVELVEFHHYSNSALSVTRDRDLEIRTRVDFDRKGHLLIRVELVNTGSATLREVCYTREWRQSGDEGWTFPYDLAGLGTSPEGICRRAWMTDDIAPGQSRSLTLSCTTELDATNAPETSRGVDVPLSLWTNATFPSGVPVGATNGISWGDYDADGFIDMFACQSGNLWRNLGGVNWVLAADLDAFLPPTGRRYGSSFGDYNNDGLPDIGTEPRDGNGGDESFHLLKNLGGGPSFVDVATDPAIVDVQPFGDAETLCWGDVDGDGDLDGFLPVYPAWAGGGPGNFFLNNLGPTGPGGAYRFTEMVDAAGLDNPPSSARPEGAQFLDVDYDGDIDLYSNGTLYQNISATGSPLFRAQTSLASGIGLSTSLEEGAAFVDYDLDGDMDLLIVYTGPGVKIWENRGDGTFFEAVGIVDSPLIGLDLGLSAEDWDNDGDIDFTTRQVFRKNMLMEEGIRHFTVATHAIPGSHLSSATPAWGDWDHDGDLDCALGNWLSTGHFYENTLYDRATPPSDRRYVRIRVVDDSGIVPAGLETAYGTSVEIRLRGPGDDGFTRKRFTASSHGYLNQNEYTLHFALPDDPAPGDPDEDLHFDVVANFPSLPSEGGWRVDKYVQNALADVNLANLTDREIKIYRSGRSVVDGVDRDPTPGVTPLLHTTTDGLALPTDVLPLQPLAPAKTASWYVGIAVNTNAAVGPVRVKEILLDAQLDDPLDCSGTPTNLAVWDVTDGPVLVTEGAYSSTTSDRNRRSYIPVDVVLEPGRNYRVVARVTSFRHTNVSFPISTGVVEATGSLSFRDLDPCSGNSVANLPTLPIRTYMALRFSETPGVVAAVPGSEPLDARSGARLLSARPSPFRTSTRIAWVRDEPADRVRVEIFDPSGRRIRQLHMEDARAGESHLVWDGHDALGHDVATGVYLYKLWIDDQIIGGGRVIRLR